MSLDLALGKTSRNWALGLDPFGMKYKIRVLKRVAEQEDVDALTKIVAAEVRDTYGQVVALTASGRLPAAQRKAYRPIFVRWQEMSTARGGKFQPADYLELSNLREANGRYAAGLAVIERARKTHVPDRGRDAGPTPSVAPPVSLAGVLFNMALGVGGLVLVSKWVDRRKKSS